MKIVDKNGNILIPMLLFWAMLVTVLRALRWPNDWAEAHWLISYEFGFLKRGLAGTLLSPFVNENSEWLIQVISSILLVIFFLILLWLCLRVIQQNKMDLSSLLISLLFLTSPYMVMSAHLNGYFDNIVIVLSVMSCVFLAKNKLFISALIISVGVLIHETVFLVGFPNVVFFALLIHLSQKNATVSKPQILEFIVKFKFILLLPIVVFLAIWVNQSLFLDSSTIKEQLITHMSQFNFIERSRSVIVPDAFTHSFVDYLTEESPKFFDRITNPLYVLQMGIPLSVLLFYGYRKLYIAGSGRLIYFIFTGVALLPLLLHLIAWDTSRIWTYPFVTSFLAVWSISIIYPDNHGNKEDTLMFVVLVLAVIVVQIFISTPLLDGAYERFSNATRLLLYAPPILMLVNYAGNKYRLRKKPH